MSCSELEYIPEDSDEFDARSFYRDRRAHFRRRRRIERQQWEADMEREGDEDDQEDRAR